MVRTSELHEYPGNARRGDVDKIAESLQENGQFQPLIVQLHTGYVLIGNHTFKATQKLGWETVAVTYVDVDDDRARKIVLAANRTADLATYDLDALAALLADVDDLTGTGYTDDDLASLNEESELDEDRVNSNESTPKGDRLGVIVFVDDEDEQLDLITRMLEEGKEARAL
jgi:ParB-like chromosome segregation protein Spo0J